MKKKQRDITKSYPLKSFVAKIRRLAEGIEKGKPFVIQIVGERVHVPKGASLSVEHERGKSEEEIEFQIVWKVSDKRKS